MLLTLTLALPMLFAPAPMPSPASDAPVSEYADLDPEETAHLFWSASVDGDWETVETLCPYADVVEWLRVARPVEVLKIGKPFRRRSYAGYYVPYEIRFEHDGKIAVKKHNLALRNDNGFGHYVIDGGI
jgi:hypothetical protein